MHSRNSSKRSSRRNSARGAVLLFVAIPLLGVINSVALAIRESRKVNVTYPEARIGVG